MCRGLPVRSRLEGIETTVSTDRNTATYTALEKRVSPHRESKQESMSRGSATS